RAVAATFCYRIRWALVPIFGPNFVEHCVHPKDPLFERMVIDSSIIRRCTQEADEMRLLATSGQDECSGHIVRDNEVTARWTPVTPSQALRPSASAMVAPGSSRLLRPKPRSSQYSPNSQHFQHTRSFR